MTDQAVEDAASRIVEAIDHLVAAVQGVTEAIVAGTTKPYELPATLAPSERFGLAPELEDEPI